MTTKERKIPIEIGPQKEIERETRRIIDEHLPTVYSLRGVPGTNRAPYSPKTVERHLFHFFAIADKIIESSASELRLDPMYITIFKLMYRQLFSVAAVETQIKAIEQGKAVALKLAGQDSAIGFPIPTSESARLFIESSKLIFLNSQKRKKPRVSLLVDDVAHSGSQMAVKIYRAKKKNPDAPVVVSVGVITDRAIVKIREDMTVNDILLYQEKKLCLEEMIARFPDYNGRQKLLALAKRFFHSQGLDAEGEENGGLRATHIITPFKLPDRCSNGTLRGVRYQDEYVLFTLFDVDVSLDSFYPKVI